MLIDLPLAVHNPSKDISLSLAVTETVLLDLGETCELFDVKFAIKVGLLQHSPPTFWKLSGFDSSKLKYHHSMDLNSPFDHRVSNFIITQ